MEDVGNQFINIFLTNSIFQDVKLNEDGDVTGFKMHDLATQVADNDCCYLNSKTFACISDMWCHLYVGVVGFNQVADFDYVGFQSEYSGCRGTISYSKFQILTCLEAGGSWYKAVGSIEILKHLRYLGLSNCDGLKIHPKSIERLVCLQTTKLSRNRNVGLSTKALSKLINLRHLEIHLLTFKDETPSESRKHEHTTAQGSDFIQLDFSTHKYNWNISYYMHRFPTSPTIGTPSIP